MEARHATYGVFARKSLRLVAMRLAFVALCVFLGACLEDERPTERPAPPQAQEEIAKLKATVPPPVDVASLPPVTAKAAPRCFKQAERVIREGTRCGLPMEKYAAERICTELVGGQHFSDKDAAARLQIFLDDGCPSLSAAVEGDRI